MFEMNQAASQARCNIYSKDSPSYSLSDLSLISNILAETNDFMWFDIINPQTGDLLLLQEEFCLHQLAIEDAIKAHQRSKIESYGKYWFIVLHGITQSDDGLTVYEIAVFTGKRFMITVRNTPTYPFDEVERRWSERHDVLPSLASRLLYQLIDSVIDGYMPIADGFIEQVDRLEAKLFNPEQNTDAILLEIYEMKKDLGRVRRAIMPIRDILQPLMRGVDHMSSLEESQYYRDIEDHIMRIAEQLDEARDLVNSARDVHLSIASHRQNQITRQLTIVATVFLPLSFITGFFGQNFSWLTDHIAGGNNFAVYGVGSEIIACISLLVLFRVRRWM